VTSSMFAGAVVIAGGATSDPGMVNMTDVADAVVVTTALP